MLEAIGDSEGVVEIVAHVQSADDHAWLEAQPFGPEEMGILVRSIPPHAQVINTPASQPGQHIKLNTYVRL